MFSFFHEFSVEITAPIDIVWEFAQKPSTWLMWNDFYESCHLEGEEFVSGKTIHVQIKNKSRPFRLLLSQVTPKSEFKTFFKALGMSEENIYKFEKLAPDRTRLTSQIHLKGWPVPFFRPIMSKKIHERKSKSLNAFAKRVQERTHK
jgi:hypothetical protein